MYPLHDSCTEARQKIILRSIHCIHAIFFCSFIGNPSLCGYWLGSLCRGPRPQERGKNHGIPLFLGGKLAVYNFPWWLCNQCVVA